MQLPLRLPSEKNHVSSVFWMYGIVIERKDFKAAKLAKKSLPSKVPFEIAKETMSPMALSFWQENRKVDNKLLCKNLG